MIATDTSCDVHRHMRADHMRMCHGMMNLRTYFVGRRPSDVKTLIWQSSCTWDQLNWPSSLLDCVQRDKREAVKYGGLIVQHLLCLKYSSEVDFQSCWKRWSAEV